MNELWMALGQAAVIIVVLGFVIVGILHFVITWDTYSLLEKIAKKLEIEQGDKKEE